MNDHVNVGSQTVTNSGSAVLRVVNPISITGHYNQTSEATLDIGVNSAANYGKLNVSDTATISSGSNIILHAVGGYRLSTGQTYTIATGAAGSDYNFDTLDASVIGFRNTLSTAVDGNALIVVVGPSSNIATTPNAITANTSLLNYGGTNPSLLSLATAVSDLTTTTEANRAGAQLGAPSTASTVQAAMQPAVDVLNVVSTRGEGARLARRDGDTGLSAGNPEAGFVLWGEGFGGFARQERREEVDGFTVTSVGASLGADTPLSDTVRVGGVFSYARTAVDGLGNLSGGSTDLDSYGLIGYVTYQANPWYMNVMAGGMLHHYESTRVVDFTGFSGTAYGKHTGYQYVGRINGGYSLSLGPTDSNFTLTPQASVTYSHLDQDGYTESGGNGAALRVGASSNDSVKSELGFKLEKGFQSEFGDIVPEFRVAWRHEFVDSRQRTNASFAADSASLTAFTTRGAKPVVDSAVIGVGVTLLKADELTVSLRSDTEVADRYIAETGLLRVRVNF